MLKLLRVLSGSILIIVVTNVWANELMTLPMGLIVEGMEPYAKKCDPKPEFEHMEELILNKEDAQQATKCLRRCLMDQFELFIDGGMQVHTEKLVGFMLLMYPDKKNELNEMVDGCNEQNNEMAIDEKCEVAHAFGICLRKEMMSREYEIPEIEQ